MRAQLPQAFWDAIDETPRTPRTIMLRDRQGELRHVPISALAEFRSRSRRSRPRLERAQNLTALLGYLLEREENDL